MWDAVFALKGDDDFNGVEGIETEAVFEEGLVVDFVNGSQVIQRINPNLKAYMDLLKIYSTLMEQIEDMIRHDRDHAKKENRGGKDVDPLEAFINAR